MSVLSADPFPFQSGLNDHLVEQLCWDEMTTTFSNMGASTSSMMRGAREVVRVAARAVEAPLNVGIVNIYSRRIFNGCPVILPTLLKKAICSLDCLMFSTLVMMQSKLCYVHSLTAATLGKSRQDQTRPGGHLPREEHRDGGEMG